MERVAPLRAEYSRKSPRCRRRRQLVHARREVEHEAELRDEQPEEQDLVGEDRLHAASASSPRRGPRPPSRRGRRTSSRRPCAGTPSPARRTRPPPARMRTGESLRIEPCFALLRKREFYPHSKRGPVAADSRAGTRHGRRLAAGRRVDKGRRHPRRVEPGIPRRAFPRAVARATLLGMTATQLRGQLTLRRRASMNWLAIGSPGFSASAPSNSTSASVSSPREAWSRPRLRYGKCLGS